MCDWSTAFRLTGLGPGVRKDKGLNKFRGYDFVMTLRLLAVGVHQKGCTGANDIWIKN